MGALITKPGIGKSLVTNEKGEKYTSGAGGFQRNFMKKIEHINDKFKEQFNVKLEDGSIKNGFKSFNCLRHSFVTYMNNQGTTENNDDMTRVLKNSKAVQDKHYIDSAPDPNQIVSEFQDEDDYYQNLEDQVQTYIENFGEDHK